MAGWLTRSRADVPAGDAWLGSRERAALGELRSERRADEWRLGRWAAKEALRRRCGWQPGEVEVLASPSGAPSVLLGGVPAEVEISISHRAGRALAVVGDPGFAIGCDLELCEPRSDAFVRTWFAPAEQEALAAADDERRAALANAIWTAKEAATKLRGEGLRLDARDAVVELGPEQRPDGEWRPLRVRWRRESQSAQGWWRWEGEWVYSFVSRPPTPAPRALF
jgi:4'-phosphopantetheinyl transferase